MSEKVIQTAGQQELKMIQPFYEMCQKDTNVNGLIKVHKGRMILTDHKSWFILSTGQKDGYYILTNGQLQLYKAFKDIKNFPTLPEFNMDKVQDLGMYDCAILSRLAVICDNPDQRELFHAINITNDRICASDAHMLRQFANDGGPAYKDLNVSILATPALASILTQSQGQFNLKLLKPVDEKGKRMVEITVSPCFKLIVPVVEEKYFNIEYVIPKYDHTDTQYYYFSPFLLRELISTARRFKSEVLYISKSGMVIENEAMELKKYWPLPPKADNPQEDPDGMIQTMVGKKETLDDNVIVRFSMKMLSRMIAYYDKALVIGVIDPTKPVGIWDSEVKQQEKKPAKPSAPTGQAKDKADKKTQPTAKPAAPVKGKKASEIIPKRKGIMVVDYNKKSFALIGDGTLGIKGQLRGLGGIFSTRLQYNSRRYSGWAIPKRKEKELRELIS